MRTPGKFPVKILVGLAGCTWALALTYLYGEDVDGAFFKPLSLVTTVVAGILAAFDQWVWRIPGVRHALGTPDLRGTWFGEIRSEWIDPKTRQQSPAISAVLVIRQTFSSLSVTMFTADSGSISVAAGIATEADSRHFVTALYRNEPRLSLQERSRVHHGGVRLAIVGEGDQLEGAYWTDRDSKGEMTFKWVTRKYSLDFDSGKRLSQLPKT